MKEKSAFTTPLLNDVREYVSKYTRDHFSEKISYHNLGHVREVVEAAEKIGRATGLSDDELETVLIAAWFHDIGYYRGQEGHEKKSVEIAEKFLKDHQYPPEKIRQVISCIMATKIPQSPHNKLDEILCDADLYNLGSSRFIEKSDELWEETKTGENEISFYEWLKNSRDFLRDHHYHTSFAKKYLEPVKAVNLRQLEERIVKMERGS